MKTNVKAGDLAIVVGAFMCTENIGRIVEVVRPAVEGVDVRSSHPDLVAWMVRSDRPLGRPNNRYTGRLPPKLEVPCADCNLRPVSGLPVDTYEKETTNARK